MTVRKKTGEKCDHSGIYAFDGYVKPENPPLPLPTKEEREIPMKVDKTFPPINSTDRAAWWKWVRRR